MERGDAAKNGAGALDAYSVLVTHGSALRFRTEPRRTNAARRRTSPPFVGVAAHHTRDPMKLARLSTLLVAHLAVTHATAHAQRTPRAVELTTAVPGVGAPNLRRLTPADVYTAADRVRPASDPCHGDAGVCVERGLRRLKAPPAVIDAASLMDGAFFTRIVPRGVVAVATSLNVYAANSNEQTWLVNGTPALIPVSFAGDEIAHVLKVDPSLVAELPPGTDHAQLMWRGDAARLVAVRQLSGGSTRYVFREDLTVGCRACRSGGRAEYAYDFDAHGRAVRKVFLRFLRGDA